MAPNWLVIETMATEGTILHRGSLMDTSISIILLPEAHGARGESVRMQDLIVLQSQAIGGKFT